MLDTDAHQVVLPARYVRKAISQQTKALLEEVLTPRDEAAEGDVCALVFGVGLGGNVMLDPIRDVALKGAESEPFRIMSLDEARRDRIALAAMAVHSDSAVTKALNFAREMREIKNPSHTRWGEAFLFPEGMIIALDMLTNQLELSEEERMSPARVAERVQMLVFPHTSNHQRLIAQSRMAGHCATMQPHLDQQLTNVGNLKILPPNLNEVLTG